MRSLRRSKGIFATRGPKRINPVGLNLIRILDVAGPAIRFAGVDLVDGTPVIDLSSRKSSARSTLTRYSARTAATISGKRARTE